MFDRAGIDVPGCNIHHNMTAWVVVVETPYFGRKGSTGRVTLPAVPPGSYRLQAWHASMPVGAPATERTLLVVAAESAVAIRLAGARP
ncbi:MAG: hypothetical protein LH632_11630 [Rhodoferax sp.]|nr:hypothetical protein [Rhodoferax sp.]